MTAGNESAGPGTPGHTDSAVEKQQKQDALDRWFEWAMEHYPVTYLTVLVGVCGAGLAWLLRRGGLVDATPWRWAAWAAGPVFLIGFVYRCWKVMKWVIGIGLVGGLFWWGFGTQGLAGISRSLGVGVVVVWVFYVIDGIVRDLFGVLGQIQATQERMMARLQELARKIDREPR